jgi:SAM-dependent methyltransferase
MKPEPGVDPSGAGKGSEASARQLPDRAEPGGTEFAGLAELVALPFLLEWCEPLCGRSVLVLGSGAFLLPKLRRYGAATVTLIDCAMGDIRNLAAIPDASLDVVLVYFQCDPLGCQQTTALLTEVHRALRAGGRCILAGAHPARSSLHSMPPARSAIAPSYFTARGSMLLAGCVHKTVQDYFECLAGAGFRALPEVAELHVTDDLAVQAPQRLAPLRDLPLHLALRLHKTGAP